MKTASAISAGLHVAVLVWATLSFSSESFNVTPPESLPVDFVSDKQFSELTKGIKDAPKPVEKPKPLVEKKADVSKPVEDLKPKVTEKKELKPAAEKTPEPPPPPEPKPKPEPKKAEKPPEPKAEPKAEPKPDPIAKKIEQQAEKPKEQKEAKATPAPMPPKKPPMRKPPKEHPKDQPKFDADKIAALLDKREPQRMAAAGETINTNPGLGRVNGQAMHLSQSELDALRRRISSCWSPPVGAEQAQDLLVVFRVVFNPDGTVKQGPIVVEGAASSFGPVFAESAKRAILQCQPYTMLHRETYNLWKDMEIGFKPSDMFR